MLRHFGARVTVEEAGPGRVIRLAGQPELLAADIVVPGDPSSAAFPLVAALLVPGSRVTVQGVGLNPLRTGLFATLREMGARLDVANAQVEGGEPVGDVTAEYTGLRGVDVPPDRAPSMIDEYPVLAAAAACAEGTTVLTGAEELRVKESDRIQAMADGLTALGIDARPTADGIRIRGGKLSGGTVESRGDHRIAMAFAMAALRATGEVVINDCTNVLTSFPGFPRLAGGAGLGIAEVMA
jgi:3-phosphoshikimate 1-carboxyvinyltransferase